MQRRSFIQLSALGAAGLAVPAQKLVHGRDVVVRVEPLKHRVIIGERVIGRLGNAPGEFNTPTAAAAHPRHIAVIDFGNYRIQLLGHDGSPKATFGSYGRGDDQFLHPAGIAIADNGDIFVADTLKGQVTRHACDGRVLARIDNLDEPRSLAIDAKGNLHIAELGATQQVRIVDASGATQHVYAAAHGKRPYILARLGPRVIARERHDYVS
jgi:hypothetical protein